ncbi:MAG: phosphate uptake regulator PhoU [Candidatus Thorarchaeota archaeon]|nr:phosphate uptake regulator PhoU [Candidatus Thorarchaeota archaeon]
MDIRRLQQTGGRTGSSFLVILPKDWVSRQNLRKGDPVIIVEREDGCLIVDPRFTKSGETRSATIGLEPDLRWSITSKYLLGFDEIRVVATDTITNEQRDELKRIIKRFVALEVTDEDDHEIVVQCLVDPSTIPVHRAMKRMNLIAARMIRDAISAYLRADMALSENVQQRDEEVDRLFFLIVRELRSAIQYPSMSEKMGVTPVEALDFRLAIQYLERIADLAVEIARSASVPPERAMTRRIEPMGRKVLEMLSKSVSNLFSFATEKVADVIAAEKELLNEASTIHREILSKQSSSSQTYLHVVDCLLRISEAAKDIVDLALPHS